MREICEEVRKTKMEGEKEIIKVEGEGETKIKH